jgi:anti-sigma regulatory factor (Ser/Thr protein kinase)
MSFPSGDPIRPDTGDDHDMVVLGRDMRSVGRARQWLRAFLDSRSAEAQVADAVLVTSELVTNALRHGLGDVVLRASIETPSAVRVSVTDSGPELPTLVPPDPTRIGGVGLRIVDELAASWGVAPFPGGKTVWVVVERPA